jgi:transposase
LTPITRDYSAEFKLAVLLWMTEQHGSVRQAAAHFNIGATRTISRWLHCYRQDAIMAPHDPCQGSPVTTQKTPSDNAPTAPHPVFHSVEEELAYLRAENAYLKKLQALRQATQQKKRS